MFDQVMHSSLQIFFLKVQGKHWKQCSNKLSEIFYMESANILKWKKSTPKMRINYTPLCVLTDIPSRTGSGLKSSPSNASSRLWNSVRIRVSTDRPSHMPVQQILPQKSETMHI